MYITMELEDFAYKGETTIIIGIGLTKEEKLNFNEEIQNELHIAIEQIIEGKIRDVNRSTK